MPPGAITPSCQQSLVSCNMFSVLPEVHLEGTGFVLPVVSRKSRQRLARRKKRLSTSLRVSAISVSPKKVSPIVTSVNSKIISSVSLCSTYDLGSDDPITLPCLVNNTHQATCMVDSGASSQFIDLDFALNLNLKLDLKPVPEDLVLADGLRSKVGQITHTCTLRLTIDQHLEDLTFHVTRLAGWNLIVGKPWLRRHNPSIDWTMNSVNFSSGFCHAHCLPTRDPPQEPKKPLGISMISRAALRVAIRQPGAECFVICLMARDGKVELKTTGLELATQLIPQEYHEYLSVFSEEEARALPPRRYVDHAIPIVDGGKPPFGRMYSMSDQDLKELKQWIEDNLSKSFIRASTSSAASPLIIVRKPGSSP